MMAMIHYKLPLDADVDKDIIEWINQFHRTKKGEMVRHAIRYYMAILEDGETIKFPNVNQHQANSIVHSNDDVKSQQDTKKLSQTEVHRKERKKPRLNMDALK